MKLLSMRRSLLTILGVAGIILGTAPLSGYVSAETIRVGAPIPVTGPFSSDGVAMEKGLKLAIAELNRKGGLLGRG